MSSTHTFAIRQFNADQNKFVDWVCEDTNPGLGKRFNAVESIGFWLIEGLRLSITHWNNSDNDTLGKIGAVALAIISAPATLIGLGVREIGRALPHPINIRTDAVFERTPKYIVDEIYEVLSAFDTVARKMNLPYFSSGGTSLGLARNGGVIPWDDDADINAFEADEEKLAQAMTELEKLGFMCTYYPEQKMYQVQPKNPHNPGRMGTLDVFIMKKVEDPKLGEVYKYSSKFFQAKFPKEYYTQEQIDSIQDFSFGPVGKRLKIRAIKKMITYLERYYGKDCLKIGLRTHDHFKLFGIIPIPLPRLNIEAVQIVDKNCAQGNNWTGQSELPDIE